MAMNTLEDTTVNATTRARRQHLCGDALRMSLTLGGFVRGHKPINHVGPMVLQNARRHDPPLSLVSDRDHRAESMVIVDVHHALSSVLVQVGSRECLRTRTSLRAASGGVLSPGAWGSVAGCGACSTVAGCLGASGGSMTVRVCCRVGRCQLLPTEADLWCRGRRRILVGLKQLAARTLESHPAQVEASCVVLHVPKLRCIKSRPCVIAAVTALRGAS
jgi:hypothetical protein